MLVGAAGSGKTILMNYKLANISDTEYEVTNVSLNYYSTSGKFTNKYRRHKLPLYSLYPSYIFVIKFNAREYILLIFSTLRKFAKSSGKTIREKSRTKLWTSWK